MAPEGPDPLRWLLPILPALAAVALVDRGAARRGLAPPAQSLPRRAAMAAILAVVFYLGIFAPVAWAGHLPRIDPESLGAPDLFFLHAVLVAALLAYFQLGYGGGGGGVSEETPVRALIRTCGLRPSDSSGEGITREIGIGLLAGPFLWLAVLLAVGAVGLLVRFLGLDDLLPKATPELIVFMASLPVLLRLALSISAGVVEEIFFRGFLQRRVGAGMSTLFFVLAHLTYDAPLMLVGVTLLSLSFAGMTALRGNVWPAVAAHSLFDAVQLLWIVPTAMELQGGEKGAPITALLAWLPGTIW